ncbi:MAG: GTP-binding protein [Roseiarcus sp.]|jgi:G3E family GTPase
MSAREPIPLHVVTGFLGAGKTSLINRMLKSAALADSLVIVNEWGEIGLDHLLFEAIDGEVISLNSGCLCCTLRGDLVDRLNDLLDRRDAGTIAPFARVILETTGLADPAPILLALAADPRLAARFRVAGVTTLVDAVNGEATLAGRGEAQRQAALADRIGLAKSDLVAADARSAELAAVRATLRALNPVAPILDVAAGELDADGFLAEPLALRRLDDAPPIAHAASVRSHVFVSATLIQPPALGRFLDLLSELLGPRLLRVKGLIGLADNPDRPLLIHGAQHVFHAPRVLPAWPDGERLSRLVVIADGVAPARIEALWAALTGAPQIDTPDLEALTDNPLAPRRGGLLA